MRDLSVGMGGAIPKKLKISEIIATCKAWKATEEDFQGVLVIEKAAYPLVVKKYQSKDSDNARNEDQN